MSIPTTTTSLRPMTHRSDVARQVAHALRLAIVSGEMEDGQRLVPEAVATQLGVSRPPVMEAIRHLAREGLISIAHNGRPYVIGLTPRYVQDLYRFRLMLDEETLYACLGRVPVEVEQGLRELIEGMTIQAGNEDLSAVATLDLRFHTSYLSLAGNQFMLHAWRAVSEVAHAVLTVTDQRALDLYRIARIHEEIVNGLCSGDDATARAALQRHYDMGFGLIGGKIGDL